MAGNRAFLAILFLFLLIRPAAARSSSGSPTPDQFVCGTSLDRTAEAIALAKFNRLRRPAALSTTAEAVTDDRGHIAVLQDDGTVITPPNRFDLANSSLTFAPAANGRYSVGIQTVAFDPVSEAATGLTLRDDDAVQVSLSFPFVYYGISYTSLYVNSDGNLTFTASDTRSTDRNLARIVAGPPRIAPFFNDLNPFSSGRVTVEKFDDRILFTWTNVGEWAQSGSVGQNTFQVVLGSNGTIRFNYQRIDASEAVVAIGPGASANPPISLVDYLGTAAPTTLPGVIAEVFASRLTMDLSQIAQIFYRNHPDSYDEIFVFADFNLSLSPAFAYAVPVRNAVRGIMNATGAQGAFYDYGSEFGSGQRLAAMVNMGDLGRFSPDPQQQLLGTNTTLSILGQEFGHRWLAFLDVSTPSMLGRADSHWSFLHNTLGSVMEGNEIEDLGNGRFQTVGATERYSPLDQYVMGLRPASEVPPWFVVADPTLTTPIPAGFPASCRNVENLPSCPPFVGLQFSGTRRDVTIDDVLARAGARVPSFPQAQKDFRVAFVLVTTRGQEPKAASLQTLEAVRTAWVSFFQTAVDGRGTMNADLLYLPSSAAEVRTQITANGSRRVETGGTATPVQVGYATLDSAAGVSIVKFISGADIRSEAAIPPATLATAFRLYVERTERVSTGLALLNVSNSAASITARLSDGQQITIQLPPRSQKSQFIHEFFRNIGTSFSGTLALTSDVPIGLVALRGTLNQLNEFIITATPLSAGSTSTERAVFPQIADGGGYVTELILLNPAETTIRGTISFSFSVTTERGANTVFDYEIAVGGAWKLQTAGGQSAVQVGFSVIEPAAGSPAPVATAVLKQFNWPNLNFEAGVPAVRPLTRGIMFGVRDAVHRTVLAMAGPLWTPGSALQPPASLRLTAYRRDGSVAVSTQINSINSNEHRARFLDELIPELPNDFEGTVILESAAPIYVITLRTLVNQSGAFLMTAMPVIDLDQTPPSTPSYFPQLVDGGNFSTEYLLMTPDGASARLQFFNPDGQALAVPIR